uniref:Putative deoxycytidylate deaminase n=1 Tax=Ixodes ricinus TaxID=34613 RepID=A0A0K8RC97_IXORI
MSVSNGDLAAKIEDLSSLVPNRLCVADSCRERRTKRDDYLPWQDYFMSSAYLAAMRSKDPNTQVGCVIVNRENRIGGDRLQRHAQRHQRRRNDPGERRATHPSTRSIPLCVMPR